MPVRCFHRIEIFLDLTICPRDWLLIMSSASDIGSSNAGRSGRMRDSLFDWISDWGRVTIDSISAVGDLALFSWNTMRWLVARLPSRGSLLPILYQVGVLSLPVVALTGTFIGMVLAVQSFFQFHQLRMETRLGAVINMSLARELGPVLAATMLAGRVGSAMAAELGTMRVTEQIDALASMGVNPVQYLVVPRFLAFSLLIPALTVMAVFMGVVGGYFYSVVILGIDKHHYLYNTQEFVGSWDLFSGILKSEFFGIAIALVSCYHGFHCRAGAEGVGKAATSAFVHSFVLILALDLMLAITLDSFYFMMWPEGSGIF
jgi:phospholipid/cholesterol/gamma-HCH transport system permease protein